MLKIISVFLLLFILSCSDSTNPSSVLNDQNSLDKNVDSTEFNAILSDYTTGVLLSSSIGDSVLFSESAIKLSGDADGYSYNGSLYILNRSSSDKASILVIRDGAVLQEKAINYMNPHSISFFNDSLAFVTLYNANKILVLNPETLDSVGIIDLPFQTDSSLCSPDQSVIIGEKLYVSLQFQKNWAPSRNGQIIVIDAGSRSIVDSINLNAKNPVSQLVKHSDSSFVVSCSGLYFGDPDGDLELVDVNLKTATSIITAADLSNGDFGDNVSYDSNLDEMFFQYGSYGAMKIGKYDFKTNKIDEFKTFSNHGIIAFSVNNNFLSIGLAEYAPETYSFFKPSVEIYSLLNDSLVAIDSSLTMSVYKFVK